MKWEKQTEEESIIITKKDIIDQEVDQEETIIEEEEKDHIPVDQAIQNNRNNVNHNQGKAEARAIVRENDL